MPILAVESVFGGWGATTIVEGVSLELAPGEVVSIVGRNGVGKSSTLEIVMGRAKLFSGRVLLDGVPIQGRPTFERCRAGLSYVPQGREVFPSLTVAENLSAAARPGEWTMARVFDLFPALRRRADNLGRQLSGGEQQMLSIGRALIGNPKVLLMDEPTEGLAPIVVEEVVEAIKQLASNAAFAVLLVEQVLDVALELSDRCLVMDRGQIVYSASADELQRSTESFHKALGFF
jgi:branched-chain amino acid transport system ATP-binding protein